MCATARTTHLSANTFVRVPLTLVLTGRELALTNAEAIAMKAQMTDPNSLESTTHLREAINLVEVVSSHERLVRAICRIDGCAPEDAEAQIEKFEEEFGHF